MTVIFLSGVPVLPLSSVRARQLLFIYYFYMILISAQSQWWTQQWQKLGGQTVTEQRRSKDEGILVLNKQGGVEN